MNVRLSFESLECRRLLAVDLLDGHYPTTPASSNPYGFVSNGMESHFLADGKLWVTNGTEDGTRSLGEWSGRSRLTRFNHGVAWHSSRGLVVSRGDSVHIVDNVTTVDSQIVVGPNGDSLYFHRFDRNHNLSQLSRTDGTPSGTELVSEFSSDVERISEVLGSYSTKVVFTTLLIDDGNPWPLRVRQIDVETGEIEGLLPEVPGGVRSSIFALDFFAFHMTGLQTDGTPVSELLILGRGEVIKRPVHYGFDFDLDDAHLIGGRLLFAEFESDENQFSTIVSDGTSEGTKPLDYGLVHYTGSIIPSPVGLHGRLLQGAGGTLVSIDPETGDQLILRSRLDEFTQDYLVDLTVAGGRAFAFFNRSGIWVTDGTVEGTSRVPAELKQSNRTFRAAAVGNAVVFANRSDEAGRELWISDGSADGTHLLADLLPTELNIRSEMTERVLWGEDLYFRALETAWVSQRGQPARAIGDVFSDLASPETAREFRVVGDSLLFVTDEGTWIAGATPGDLHRVSEAQISSPIASVNGDIAYLNDDSSLWRLTISNRTLEQILDVNTESARGRILNVVQSANSVLATVRISGTPEELYQAFVGSNDGALRKVAIPSPRDAVWFYGDVEDGFVMRSANGTLLRTNLSGNVTDITPSFMQDDSRWVGAFGRVSGFIAFRRGREFWFFSPTTLETQLVWSLPSGFTVAKAKTVNDEVVVSTGSVFTDEAELITRVFTFRDPDDVTDVDLRGDFQYIGSVGSKHLFSGKTTAGIRVTGEQTVAIERGHVEQILESRASEMFTAGGATYIAAGRKLYVTDGTRSGTFESLVPTRTLPELIGSNYYYGSGVAESEEVHLRADINRDRSISPADVDTLFAIVNAGQFSQQYDFDRDTTLTQRDVANYLENHIYTKSGDANFDRRVDFADFLALSSHFGSQGTWADGDFNGDGVVDDEDFELLRRNFG